MPRLRCPGGLRPGQVGLLVLRRVIMGDVAVTVVDLAQRGFLAVDERGTDWIVRPQPVLNSARIGLLGYERVLLDALNSRYAAIPLSAMTPEIGPSLAGVRAGLVREAVSQGWIHRWDHGKLTSDGERLAAELSDFGQRMRELSGREGESALAADLLPYALRYQLVSRQELPLARFAAAWVEEFGQLPGWRAPARKHPEPTDRGMYAPPVAGYPGLD